MHHPVRSAPGGGNNLPLESGLHRPTSVVIYGSSRPLLNWVAYALAAEADPEFIWNDVRLRGEVLSEFDPLSRNLIPPERLNVAFPNEFAPEDRAANIVRSGVVRDDESHEHIRRLTDFLRLPLGAQRVLARRSAGNRPMVLVLSNGHRLVALYPSGTLAPSLRIMNEVGATLIMTFADASPASHRAFGTILVVEGNDVREWKRATLRVLKGPADGPLRTGVEYRLGEYAPLADILTRQLP